MRKEKKLRTKSNISLVNQKYMQQHNTARVPLKKKNILQECISASTFPWY